jgi:hypothetical protein
VKGPFTPLEDQLLINGIRDEGRKWKQLTRLFPGRTDTMLKNRWLVLHRRGIVITTRAQVLPNPDNAEFEPDDLYADWSFST